MSQPNHEASLVIQQAPELRIVADDLWQAVKQRQARLDQPGSQVRADNSVAPFWSKQRPRYLLVLRPDALRRLRRGDSPRSAPITSAARARNQGPTACTNRLTVRRDVVEDTVLAALRERLMDPELFAAFVSEFTAEWNGLQGQVAVGVTAKRQELDRVGRQIERMVDAIAEGTPAASLRDRLLALERRKAELEADLAGAEAPAPRLHPGLADIYRERVATLSAALAADDAAEARELVRGLAEEVRLMPEAGNLRTVVRGALAAILRLAEGAERRTAPTLWSAPCWSGLRWMRGQDLNL